MLLKRSLIPFIFSASSVGVGSAFTTPGSYVYPTISNKGLKSAVVAGDVNGVAKGPKAWDCDDEANCVQVDACDEEQCRTSLDVRIHGEWYDLSGE